METEKPKSGKLKKTKTFLYHASGASDFVYAKKVLSESADVTKHRLSRLKQLFSDIRPDDDVDLSQKNYADFNLTPEKEQALLTTLKNRKQRWLILLAILVIVWLCAAAVVLATFFVDNLPLSIYLKTFGFLLIVSVFLAYIFLKSATTEFLAWQIVNQRHSVQENGNFKSFKSTDWVRAVLNFYQCGAQI